MRTITGVSLSGGGAKGLAHLGTLKAIKRKKIPIRIVTGSSIGALVAGIYAMKPEIVFMEDKIRSIIESDEFKSVGFDKFVKTEDLSRLKKAITSTREYFMKAKTFFASSVLGNEKLRALMDTIYGDCRFEDTQLKLGIVSIDVKAGKEEIITKGKIVDAIMASIAIPGIFPVIEDDGKIFVDGASASHIPVSAARKMGANFVIASDVSGEFRKAVSPRTGWEVQLRIDEIAKHKLAEHELSQADIIISPRVKEIGWAQFDKIDTCIQEGEKEADISLANWRKNFVKAQLKNLFVLSQKTIQ